MIELEISELFLWVWCIGATAAAIYFRHHSNMREMVIMSLLHNDKVREKLVSELKEWREKHGSQ